VLATAVNLQRYFRKFGRENICCGSLSFPAEHRSRTELLIAAGGSNDAAYATYAMPGRCLLGNLFDTPFDRLRQALLQREAAGTGAIQVRLLV
jgi:hypothetical protein